MPLIGRPTPSRVCHRRWAVMTAYPMVLQAARQGNRNISWLKSSHEHCHHVLSCLLCCLFYILTLRTLSHPVLYTAAKRQQRSNSDIEILGSHQAGFMRWVQFDRGGKDAFAVTFCIFVRNGKQRFSRLTWCLGTGYISAQIRGQSLSKWPQGQC